MPQGPWSTSPAAVTVLQSTDLMLVSHDNGDTTFTSKKITVANAALTWPNTVITSGAVGSKTLITKNIANQTASNFEAQSSAGVAYVTIGPDVLPGNSQTVNFLNVTGTLNSVNSVATNGINFSITGAGSSSAQHRAMLVSLNAGYTGSSTTIAYASSNASAGTGASAITTGSANYCASFATSGTTTGNNAGFFSTAIGSSTLNLGGVFRTASATNSPALNVGMASFSLLATVNVAGFFGLMSTAPTLGTSCALVADSGATGNEVANFRVNGTVISKVTGGGWFQNTIGEASLTAAFTDAVGTLAATNLSITVVAGRSYRIEGYLIVSNTTATDGSQFDFNGGTATATLFDIAFSNVGSVVAGTVVGSALNTKLNYTTNTGTDRIYVRGFLKVNAAGTLILRAATNTTVAGTMTLAAGSYLALTDTVQL